MAKVIDPAIETMIANLHEKTGKTLEQRVAIGRSSGKTRHGEIVAALNGDDGLTHGYANLVARRVLEPENEAPAGADDLVSGQYCGAKAALKPLYDAIIATARSFGADVEVDPKKAYVSLRRKKQFGLVQPSTARRLELGLNPKGVVPVGRLKASGSFNAMCSHRVRPETPSDLDGSVKNWLRRAYDAS